jgi:hypothetical protein
MEGKAHIISIYGYPLGSIAKKFVPLKGKSSSSNKLVDLKSQFKDGTVRNMTAMGGLLKDIADIANYIELKNAEDQPQQQKSAVAKPVATTPTTSQQTTKQEVPAGIQNQQRTLSNKIPMGSTLSPTQPEKPQY